MIDIGNARKEFIKYTEEYNINLGRINLKVKHILRVSQNCKLLAKNLNLNDEQVKLAELIGLFHDIGRFEQVRLYNTFSDKDSGLDHAAYSLKVLYDDGLINRFLGTNKYDDVIKKAVFNHNKARIDESIEGDALLFSKIIRDADKLDIYRVINEEEMKDIFWYEEFENVSMSEKLMDCFINDRFINYKDIKTNADLIYVFYGYIYDFNFPYCLKIIRDNKYLEKFYNRIKETFKSENINRNTEKILDICDNFIKEEIEKI